MKNNVLSAFVVFFAVVACLLIIDDISHNVNTSDKDASELNNEVVNSESAGLATLDLDAEQ